MFDIWQAHRISANYARNFECNPGAIKPFVMVELFTSLVCGERSRDCYILEHLLSI